LIAVGSILVQCMLGGLECSIGLGVFETEESIGLVVSGFGGSIQESIVVGMGLASRAFDFVKGHIGAVASRTVAFLPVLERLQILFLPGLGLHRFLMLESYYSGAV